MLLVVNTFTKPDHKQFLVGNYYAIIIFFLLKFQLYLKLNEKSRCIFMVPYFPNFRINLEI